MSDKPRNAGRATAPRSGQSRRNVLAAGALGWAAVPAMASASQSAASKPQTAAAGRQTVELEAPADVSRLSIGVTSNPRTWPLIDGRVKLKNADLAVHASSAGDLFFRQLTRSEFDISEMSNSMLMMAQFSGDRRFIPIPVFTSRYFFHSRIYVRKDAHIRTPADLKGRRVGVPEYMMTGALWTRGVLQDEFGVRPEDVEWWMERLPDASHGRAIGRKPPSSVRLHQIPATKNVGAMMLDGELDAAVMYIWNPQATPEVRSTVDLAREPSITTLFPDPQAENERYYKKTGIYHINHCALVKRDVAERTPGLVDLAMRIFTAAADLGEADREEANAYHIETGLIDGASATALARRLTPYGLDANRKTMETIARYAHEQGFTPERVDMDVMFSGR